MHLIAMMALACVSEAPKNATFNGPGVVLRQTGGANDFTLELVDKAGATRWKVEHARGFHEPTFSDDGRYVADTSKEQLRLIGPEGTQASFEPMSLLSRDEVQALGRTSCGPPWFGGMRFEKEALIVLVRQAPFALPIGPKDTTPKLELIIELASGKMSRRTPAQVVTVSALIDKYREQPAERAAAAGGLASKAEQRDPADAAKLREFALASLPKAEGASVQESLLYVLEIVGNGADREWVGSNAIKAGWPPFAVTRVLDRAPAKAKTSYARAVLDGQLVDVNARSWAVRELAPEPDGLKYLEQGLTDPDRYVRGAAEQAQRTLPANDDSFAFLTRRAKSSDARMALAELFVARGSDGAKNPWGERFEQACDGAMKNDWPGCEAWTGAMADVRGDTALAKSRYQRALAGMRAEVEDGVWSAEVESYFRVQVRLIRLARAEKRDAEVGPAIEALKQSTWWPRFRVECSTGLPRALADGCDGGRARDRLIAELQLEPKTKPVRP